MTPATLTSGFWYDISLEVGQSYSDPAAGLTATTTDVNSAGATIQITMNGSTCTQASPTVTVSPAQNQGVTSGIPVNFTVTVTNNDSAGCSSATFSLGSTVPSGWGRIWNAGGLSLSPGKSGSATLTVTSPAGTADGSYNVSVSATNASAGSYNGSAA